jgi:hypothetical protein
MQKRLVCILVVIQCFIFYFIVGALINLRHATPLDYDTIRQTFMVPQKYFSPEPNEHMQYIIDVLATPFLCALLYLGMTRLVARESNEKRKKLYRILSLIAVILLAFIIGIGLRFAQYDYLGSSSITRAPLLTLLLGMVMFAMLLLGKPLAKKFPGVTQKLVPLLYFSAGVFLVGLMFAETVFNEADPTVAQIHFDAYFDSVAQTYLGQAALVNFLPQYGMYAWLLNPLFRVIGLNVLKFTIVMSLLKASVYASLLLVLYKVTRNKFIAFTGFTTIAFYFRIRGPVEMFSDPYFQFDPHRLFFPVVFVTLLAYYLGSQNLKTRRILYFIITALSALSVLWNPDTGIVVLASWIITLCFGELLQFKHKGLWNTLKACAGHILFVVASAGTAVFVLCLSIYVKTGIWPNPSDQFVYTKLFYDYGYFMLPMPRLHPWNVLAMAYIVGILVGVSHLLDINGFTLHTVQETHETQSKTQFIFTVSILGVGLFNYYLGRSHDFGIIGVSWPMVILITLLIDRLFQNLSGLIYHHPAALGKKAVIATRQSFQVLLFIGLFAFASSSITSIAISLGEYQNLIKTRWMAIQTGTPDNLRKDARFIQATSRAEDRVLIISDYAPELYLYTNHSRPINVAGFGELVLTADLQQIKDFLNHPPDDARIYWDTRFEDVNEYDLFELNPENYPALKAVGASPDGTLVLFEKAP